MQAHDLHEHLVGIGGAIEGAGARAVIRLHLGVKQFGAADLAFGIQRADAGLLVVAHATGHGAAGHEYARQMAENQGANQQAGHDLVAHPEVEPGVEHLVAQRHRRGHGDDVARKQRQLHAGLPLGHAVAHRGHAPGELRRGARRLRSLLDPGRKRAQRLVRREHVVVRGNDGQIGPGLRADFLEHQLSRRRGGRHRVRQVGAGEVPALDLAAPRCAHARQISLAPRRATRLDALRHSH